MPTGGKEARSNLVVRRAKTGHADDPAYDGDRPCIIKLAARLWLLADPLPPGIKKAAPHLPITVF